MSETKRRYAQIEKEALAITWACEKFSTYVLGKRFSIETNHKPLVPLLGSKHLDSLPPRVLRFRLRLPRFDYAIEHVPGKYLYTAGTLSRAPLSFSDDDPTQGVLAELAMEACVAHIPAGQSRLSEYEKAQNSDPLRSLVIKYCRTGWPGKKVDEALTPYWEAQGDLTLHGNLLLYRTRIVVPASMHRETLTKLHEAHQGIERCRQRIRISVWWLGVSKEMEEFVRNSPHCAKESSPRKEPLLQTSLPDYPSQKIGTDLWDHTYRCH